MSKFNQLDISGSFSRGFMSRPDNAMMQGGGQKRPEGGQSGVYNALAAGGGPTNAASNMLAGGAPAMPDGDMAAYLRQGLVDRGLPEHVADAFILNMKDESGLDPGINEHEPVVAGSRGGFGLYQLTGPRRVAYEEFARERGAPLDDVDAQLDFLMTELQGPERSAASRILAADNTGEAAAAIVNDFLRPAPEYRAKRAQRYMAY